MSLASALIGTAIRFAATSYVVRVTANAVTTDLPFPAAGSLSTTTDYFMSGDGTATDLVTILATAISAHAQLGTVTGSISSWRLSLDDSTNVDFTIAWDHANNTLDPLVFGFTDATPVAADPLVSTNMPQGLWRPERPIAFDSRDRQPIIGGVGMSVAGDIRISSFGTPYKERDISFVFIPQAKILDEYVASTEPYGAFEYNWVNSIAVGRVLRLFEDESTLAAGTYTAYRVRDLADPMVRSQRYDVFWDVLLRLKRIT